MPLRDQDFSPYVRICDENMYLKINYSNEINDCLMSQMTTEWLDQLR